MTPRLKIGLAMLMAIAVACVAVVLLRDDDPGLAGNDGLDGLDDPAFGAGGGDLIGTSGANGGAGGGPAGPVAPGGATLMPGARLPKGIDLSKPDVRRSEMLKLIAGGSDQINWREVGKLLAIMTEPIPDELRQAMLNELRFGRGRNQVMHAFSALRDPAITDDLFDILDDTNASRGAQRAVLEALWRIPGADADTVALKLESRLTNEVIKDRGMLETIARRGGVEAARTLVQYLERAKKPGDVPGYILRFLDVTQNPEVAAVIDEALRQPQNKETMSGLIDLAAKSGASIFTSALIDLDHDRTEATVRTKTFTALAMIGDEKAVEYLIEKAGESGDYGQTALYAIRRISAAPAGARERLVKALESAGLNPRPDEAKESLLLALGTLREKKAIPTVSKYLDDPNPRVREAAARSLGRVGPDARPHVDRLARLFNEGTPRTKNAVVNALTSIGGRGAMEAMTEMLKTKGLSLSLERTLKMGIRVAQDELDREAGGDADEDDEEDLKDG